MKYVRTSVRFNCVSEFTIYINVCVCLCVCWPAHIQSKSAQRVTHHTTHERETRKNKYNKNILDFSICLTTLYTLPLILLPLLHYRLSLPSLSIHRMRLCHTIHCYNCMGHGEWHSAQYLFVLTWVHVWVCVVMLRSCALSISTKFVVTHVTVFSSQPVTLFCLLISHRLVWFERLIVTMSEAQILYIFVFNSKCQLNLFIHVLSWFWMMMCVCVCDWTDAIRWSRSPTKHSK